MTILLGMIVILLGILTLVSYTDRVYTEMGKFLSREFQENIEVFERDVEPRLKVSRDRAALSMSVLEHTSLATLAVLITYAVFHGHPVTSNEIIVVAITLLVVIMLCQHLLPFIFFSRTRGEWAIGLARSCVD